jgi:hypothetical protein
MMRILFGSFPRLSTYPPATQEILEVIQDEWAPTPSRRITENAGACVLLAAHNPAARLAGLGHFSCVSDLLATRTGYRLGREAFDEMLEALADPNRFGPLEETALWLGGAAILGDPEQFSPDDIMHERGYASTRVHALRDRGLRTENITTDWTPEPYDVAHAEIDAPDGQLTIEWGNIHSLGNLR